MTEVNVGDRKQRLNRSTPRDSRIFVILINRTRTYTPQELILTLNDNCTSQAALEQKVTHLFAF